MSEEKKNLPLTQAAGDDHAAKILREKIGDVLSLGDKPPPLVSHDAASSDKVLEEKIIAALRTIYDPEIPVNIYDLGLIYHLMIEPTNAVKVRMTLTAPGCPVADDLVASVRRNIEAIAEVPKVEVELVWDPPWTKDRLSEAARLELGLL